MYNFKQKFQGNLNIDKKSMELYNKVIHLQPGCLSVAVLFFLHKLLNLQCLVLPYFESFHRTVLRLIPAKVVVTDLGGGGGGLMTNACVLWKWVCCRNFPTRAAPIHSQYPKTC